MADNIDESIKDLAEVHGYTDMSDDGIREVRSTLANNFLDGMLDSSSEQVSTEESHNDNGKT